MFRGWRVAVALIAAIALIAGGWALASSHQAGASSVSGRGGQPPAAVAGAAATLLYTSPTATQASIVLPQSIRATLVRLGMESQAISLVRVEPDGTTTARNIDLTPRLDGRPDGPILKLEARARDAISALVTGIEAEMNKPSADSSSRAMYSGLLRTSFPKDKPIILVSALLDLKDPMDARELGFGVSPDRVAEVLVESGYVPELQASPVTFVVVPTAGEQQQLRAPEIAYLKEVWRTVLKEAAHASTIEFIGAPDGNPSRASGPTPVVDLPELPGTPITPTRDPKDPDRTVCVVPSTTYFAYGKANLTDEAKAAKALKPCIDKALVADAELSVDAWTSYEGALGADGRPTHNPKSDRALAQARAKTIATLLVEHLGVARNRIISVVGHGSANQPFSDDPRSPRNRVVTVSYTN